MISLTSADFLLSAFYILLILLATRFIKQNIANKRIASLLQPFILFKIACAIVFAILHLYVYRGGDTFLYFGCGKIISTLILNYPEKTFSFIFGSFDYLKQFPEFYESFVAFGMNDPTTLAQSQITAIFFLIGFNNFLPITILLSMISAWGMWALFSTLCRIYPRLYKQFSYCVLFFPTLAIWSSGILKDTITLAAVGLIFQAFYRISKNEKKVYSAIIILVSTIFCLQLKPYILYTYVPALLLFLQGQFSRKIKSKLLNSLIAPLVVLSFAIGGYYFLTSISKNAGKYSIENVKEVAEGFQSWHTHLAETRDQSGYSLGEVEFTPLGILAKTPEAFFVTYYRPLPFEIRNSATALESIESTILLLLTFYIIFKVGVFRFFKIIFSNVEVRSFLIFAIFLGVAVGLTSYNFGALSRYKIPSLPFFTSALAIIHFIGTNKSAVKLKRRRRNPKLNRNGKIIVQHVN